MGGVKIICSLQGVIQLSGTTRDNHLASRFKLTVVLHVISIA